MIPRDAKPIFTILLQRHSPARFERAWQEGERRFQEPGSKASYARQNPRIHRYNDLAGFAEVYWDRGTRIDVDYFLLADRRTRFGKALTRKAGERPLILNSQKFYGYRLNVDSGFVPRRGTPNDKRKAIGDALDAVQKMCNELGCFVDLSREHEITDCLDVDRFFLGGHFDGLYDLPLKGAATTP